MKIFTSEQQKKNDFLWPDTALRQKLPDLTGFQITASEAAHVFYGDRLSMGPSSASFIIAMAVKVGSGPKKIVKNSKLIFKKIFYKIQVCL